MNATVSATSARASLTAEHEACQNDQRLSEPARKPRFVGAALREGSSLEPRMWRWGATALGGAILVGTIGGVWVVTLAQQRRAAEAGADSLAGEPRAATMQAPAGAGSWNVPPSISARDELQPMLHAKDEHIDLALANWLIAAGIPQFSDMSREAYFKQLDNLTEQVRRDMAVMRASGWKGANPDDPASRCRMFCNAMIRLKFEYREEFREEDLPQAQLKAMYADANNTFLAGLLRTRRGSCVSMPLIYLVIGQRLGLPVHLVTVGKHYFIRWDEPGYRMNIETTIVEKVAVTPDDSVYLDAEGLKRDQVTGSQLRNLTRREVVGNLFYTRSCYWGMKGVKFRQQSLQDLARARELSPDDLAIKAVYDAVFTHYGIKPEYNSMAVKPKQ
jgi:hypothetical protein